LFVAMAANKGMASEAVDGIIYKPLWMCHVDAKWGQPQWSAYPAEISAKLEEAYQTKNSNPVVYMWRPQAGEGKGASASISQTVSSEEPPQKKAGIMYEIRVGDDQFGHGFNGVQERDLGSKVTRRGVRRFLTAEQ